MKKLGDRIQWDTVHGPRAGEIVEMKIKYTVRTESGRYVIVTEEELQDETTDRR